MLKEEDKSEFKNRFKMRTIIKDYEHGGRLRTNGYSNYLYNGKLRFLKNVI